MSRCSGHNALRGAMVGIGRRSNNRGSNRRQCCLPASFGFSAPSLVFATSRSATNMPLDPSSRRDKRRAPTPRTFASLPPTSTTQIPKLPMIDFAHNGAVSGGFVDIIGPPNTDSGTVGVVTSDRKIVNRLLTINDVASWLSCSPKTVRRLIGSKTLPAFRIIGYRGLRIRPSDVECLLQPVDGSGSINDQDFAYITNVAGAARGAP